MNSTLEKQNIDDNQELTALRAKLINEFTSDASKDFVLKKIIDDVFAISMNKRNINSFVDGNGEVIINLSPIAKDYFYKKACVLAGYVEEKIDGEYLMYHVSGMKLSNGVLTPVKGDQINKYTEEYFQAWLDIHFFESRLWIKSLFISDDGGLTSIESYDVAKIVIKSLAMKIEDLERFLEQGQITQEIFDKSIKLYEGPNGILMKQLGNKNFAKVDESITIEDVEGYYKKGYISKDLYEMAIQTLKEFEKVDKKKKDESKGLVTDDLQGLKNSFRNP